MGDIWGDHWAGAKCHIVNSARWVYSLQIDIELTENTAVEIQNSYIWTFSALMIKMTSQQVQVANAAISAISIHIRKFQVRMSQITHKQACLPPDKSLAPGFLSCWATE